MNQRTTNGMEESTVLTYPKRLYWTALLLSLLSAIIHVYFGLLVYSGLSSFSMLGIATVYIVGILFVIMNVWNRRDIWLKAGTVWAAVLVVLWAAAAFLGNASHTMDLLGYGVNGVEVVLIITLLGLQRDARVHTVP